MAMTACPKCGGRRFTGSVSVDFFNVPIEIGPDGFRLPDWAEGTASGDEVTSAVCNTCGHEQRNPDAE